ncbi:hypothetical protein M0R45_030564 [Rubus argutus]|uniref:Uncharacterized protein n=1 Tax=Rubus argutus TaxID=59490 RepID=A0AAW1WDE4_RUBAR
MPTPARRRRLLFPLYPDRSSTGVTSSIKSSCSLLAVVHREPKSSHPNHLTPTSPTGPIRSPVVSRAPSAVLPPATCKLRRHPAWSSSLYPGPSSYPICLAASSRVADLCAPPP